MQALRSQFVRRILLTLLGVGLLSLLIWKADLKVIGQHLATIGWGFGWLCLLSLTWRTISSTGMWIMMPPHRRAPWLDIILIRMAGEAVNTLTPFLNVGGEPVKAVLLSHHIGGEASTGYVVLDKMATFVSSALFMATGLIIGAVYLREYPLVLISCVLIVAAMFLGLGLLGWRQAKGDLVQSLSRVVRIFGRELSPKMRERIENVDAVLSEFWRDHPGRFITSVALHFLGRALRCVDVWLVVTLLGLEIGWGPAWFVAAVGMLANTVFAFIPGALGAFEGGHAFVFALLGLGGPAGITVGLVRRVRTWTLAALTYVIVIVYPTHDRRALDPTTPEADGDSPCGPAVDPAASPPR